MYETEIKIEINDEQKDKLLTLCKERNFIDKGIANQKDYYIKAVQSQHGDPKAFDIERYRKEGDEFFYTKKFWEIEDSTPIRREEEKEVTSEEFNLAISKYPNALKIVKDRQWLGASFEDIKISLSIDSVKFDHSLNIRYFVEPEILVSDKKLVHETKKFLLRFVSDLFNIDVSEIVEAPGMFAMAFKKL